MRNKPIRADLVACGEVGLSGEVRLVKDVEKRIEEAERMGYKSFITSLQNVKIKERKIKVISVKTLKEAIEIAVE